MVRVDAHLPLVDRLLLLAARHETGTVIDPAGIARDLTIDGNSSDPERKYAALNAQASWRLGTRLNVNGELHAVADLGHLRRRDAEQRADHGGPDRRRQRHQRPRRLGHVPGVRAAAWNQPEGDLATDQRHRARILGRVTGAARRELGPDEHQRARADELRQPLLRRRPGQPDDVRHRCLGYQTPPTQVAYFFTDRDAFRTDNVFRTDLAVNYTIKMRGTSELFFQTQVWNLFNADAIADVNNIDVTTRTRDGGTATLTRFNPFTETPVAGHALGAGPGVRHGAEQERVPGAAPGPVLGGDQVLTS